MNCFRHPDLHAVAICKHCGKGTCSSCAIEGAGGVACSDDCAKRVAKVEEMVQSAAAATGMSRRGAAYFQPAFLLVLGLAFLIHAHWFTAPERAGFGLMLGGLFVLFGIGLGAIQLVWQRRAATGVNQR